MCGCNTNVKFSDKPKPEGVVYEVPIFSRKVTTSCDTFGNCGKVETLNFRPSEMVASGSSNSLNAVRTNISTSGFPKEAFSVSLQSMALTAIGLRQIAEEFASMADELDGQKTVLSLVSMAKTSKKKVKKKSRK